MDIKIEKLTKDIEKLDELLEDFLSWNFEKKDEKKINKIAEKYHPKYTEGTIENEAKLISTEIQKSIDYICSKANFPEVHTLPDWLRKGNLTGALIYEKVDGTTETRPDIIENEMKYINNYLERLKNLENSLTQKPKIIYKNHVLIDEANGIEIAKYGERTIKHTICEYLINKTNTQQNNEWIYWDDIANYISGETIGATEEYKTKIYDGIRGINTQTKNKISYKIIENDGYMKYRLK